MGISFKKGHSGEEILVSWWAGLQQDKGGRASLRRCKSSEEVMMEPAFHRLLNRMKPLIDAETQFPVEVGYFRLAAVAGLLSHVTVDVSKPLAEQMAEPKGGRPLFSSLRFRRLLKEPIDDLYPAMIRVIRQLKKNASLSDLAESVYYWGDTVRKRWALAYFPRVVE